MGYAGADLKLIRRQTGHKRIDILDGRYINIDSEEVADQLDKLRNSNGGASDQVVGDIDVDQVADELLADPRIRAAMVRKLKEELLASLGGVS